MKHHDRKRLGAERLRSQSTMKGSQSRNLRQELKQRPGRNAACWLGLHGLLSSHPYVFGRPTWSGVAPPSVGWPLLHSSLVKGMPHRHTHKPIWWGHFHSLGSCLPDDPRLYQLTNKQTNKTTQRTAPDHNPQGLPFLSHFTFKPQQRVAH